MPQQTIRRFLRSVGNPSDPDGLFQWIQRYLDHIRARGYTCQTLWGQERYLRDFLAWCDAQNLHALPALNRERLEGYLQHLQSYRTQQGQPLAWHSKQSKLIPVRSFFRWLVQYGHLTENPAQTLYLAKQPSLIPKHILSDAEAARLLAAPDVTQPMGIRDRAMMEVLFSTGIRRMELAGLHLSDVNFESGTLMVRHGKGDKDRIVPIGARALVWVRKYLDQVRSKIAAEDETVLFLTQTGQPFSFVWISTVIGNHVRKALPGKHGACHLLRHSMATLMLENGADIRYIQTQLGHSQLSTTQIYTRVSISQLKSVHERTHPTSRLQTKEPVMAATAESLPGLANVTPQQALLIGQGMREFVNHLPAIAGWLQQMAEAFSAAGQQGKQG